MASVFLVDDHPDVGEVVVQLLKMHGHQVELITSGEAALKQIELVRPQAVITDQRLPKMTGVDLLKAIRSDPRFGDVLCVLFSADADIRDLAEQAGAHRHWVKGSDSLFDSIAQLQALIDSHRN